MFQKCDCIFNYYFDIPVYSWSVTVITHEEGHILGSLHTHDCAWNGNSTAIDGCGPAAGYPGGSCPDAPIPTMGTIMSYCYIPTLSPNPPNPGVDLSLGFGHQPDSVIIYTINNANCLSALPCETTPEFEVKDRGVIILYPNPNRGTFTLEISNVSYKNIELNVYNILGKLVYHINEEAQTTSGIYSKKIDLINYPAGVYFLQIIDDNNNRTNKKIVID